MSLIRDVIVSLNQSEVSYVVVGGVAVVLHGRARLTMDLDLAIRLDDLNIRKTLVALEDLGLRPRLALKATDFADAATRQEWIEQRGMAIFSFFDPMRAIAGVDLLLRCPINYDELLSRSVIGDLGGTDVRVAGLNDLIVMKKLAGRQVDLWDVADLEKIARESAAEFEQP